MELNLGPISARLYSGSNWTHAELAWVSNRNGGMARRETAINAGFKSDHITDMVGRDNPADTFEDPATGTLYFGKIVSSPTGVYAISAKDHYMVGFACVQPALSGRVGGCAVAVTAHAPQCSSALFVSDMVPCPVENTFYLCTMSVTTGCHDGDRVPCQ